MKSLEIKLKKGFGHLTFGQKIEEVMEVIGRPDETEDIISDVEYEAIACIYNELQATFFFEGENNSTFTCVESSHPDILLFGKKIFSLSEAEIIDLMASNGYDEPEIEDETWGEKRISFDQGFIDFYYDSDKMSAVNWGVFINESGEIQLS